VEGSTPSADERFAEWFVWAKREVGSDNRVCLGAAQAAVEAEDAGSDEAAARAAGRRSVAGHGIALVGRIDPRRRAYAEWYDWARREVGGDRARMHTAARAAIQLLDHGANPADAAAAALAAAGPKPQAPASPQAPQTAGQAVPPTHPAAAPAVPVPPPPVQAPAPVASPQPWAPQAPAQQAHTQQAAYQPYAPPSYAPLAPGPYAAPVAAPPAPTRAYAGFGRRLAAYVIDAVLLTIGLVVLVIVLSIFAVVGLLSSGQDLADPNLNLGVTLSFYAIAFVLSWLYFAGLESSAWQATIGKRALGLLVTDANGRRIGFGRATGRYFAKLPVGIIGIVVAFVAAVVLLIVLGLAGNPGGPQGTVVGLVALLVGAVSAGGVTALFIQATRRRQGLHDLMAGTLVVRREYLSEITSPVQETRPASGHPGAGGPREVQGA
jgi:uncharacterized RDD family membrane protein YckC